MFSQKIKLLRKALKLSQKELASELNMPERTIASYETGRDPSVLFLVKMCEKYNMNANWFISGFGAMFNDTPLNGGKDEFTLKVEEILRQNGLI